LPESTVARPVGLRRRPAGLAAESTVFPGRGRNTRNATQRLLAQAVRPGSPWLRLDLPLQVKRSAGLIHIRSSNSLKVLTRSASVESRRCDTRKGSSRSVHGLWSSWWRVINQRLRSAVAPPQSDRHHGQSRHRKEHDHSRRGPDQPRLDRRRATQVGGLRKGLCRRAGFRREDQEVGPAGFEPATSRLW